MLARQVYNLAKRGIQSCVSACIPPPHAATTFLGALFPAVSTAHCNRHTAIGYAQASGHDGTCHQLTHNYGMWSIAYRYLVRHPDPIAHHDPRCWCPSSWMGTLPPAGPSFRPVWSSSVPGLRHVPSYAASFKPLRA